MITSLSIRKEFRSLPAWVHLLLSLSQLLRMSLKFVPSILFSG
jgi:hypothetical protein